MEQTLGFWPIERFSDSPWVFLSLEQQMGWVYWSHLHFWNIVGTCALQGWTSRLRKSWQDIWPQFYWSASKPFQFLGIVLKISVHRASVGTGSSVPSSRQYIPCHKDHLVSSLPLVVSLTLAWNASHCFSRGWSLISPRTSLKAGMTIPRKTSVTVSNIIPDRICSSSVSLSIFPILVGY